MNTDTSSSARNAEMVTELKEKPKHVNNSNDSNENGSSNSSGNGSIMSNISQKLADGWKKITGN